MGTNYRLCLIVKCVSRMLKLYKCARHSYGKISGRSILVKYYYDSFLDPLNLAIILYFLMTFRRLAKTPCKHSVKCQNWRRTALQNSEDFPTNDGQLLGIQTEFSNGKKIRIILCPDIR